MGLAIRIVSLQNGVIATLTHLTDYHSGHGQLHGQGPGVQTDITALKGMTIFTQWVGMSLRPTEQRSNSLKGVIKWVWLT